MVNQNFDKFNEVQQKHKSEYLGGEKRDRNKLTNNKNTGINAGAEGRKVNNFKE